MKKLKWWHWLIIVTVGMILINGIFDKPESKEEAAARSAQEQENALISKQKDDLSMGLIKSRRLLKETLKDPDSFQEIEESHHLLREFEEDSSMYMQVIISYRAKNSFGGYAVGKYQFIYDSNLNLTDSKKLSK